MIIIIIIILVWGFYEVSVSFIRSECFIIMAWVFSFFHYFLVCIVCCDLSHLVQPSGSFSCLFINAVDQLQKLLNCYKFFG